MEKSILLWSSVHQLDYIPASPALGCRYPPSRCQAASECRVRQAHTKCRRARSGSSSWGGKGEVPRELSCPLWFHYRATASPRWGSVRAVLLSLAPVQLQPAHAWNWSRALGTGSGKKQAQLTESPASFLDKIQSTRLALTVTLQIWTWSKCSRGNWLREREAMKTEYTDLPGCYPTCRIFLNLLGLGVNQDYNSPIISQLSIHCILH